MAPLLLEWKKEHTFLGDCPSQSLQQTLMAQDRAIKDAFNKKSPKKFPQFKKKGQHDSFRYPQGIKVSDNRVFLPKIKC
jgi:putative transposase